MAKRKWEDLSKDDRTQLIALADSMFVPPNYVPSMYEDGKIELP
jgi:hypothetical protein